RGSPAVDPVNAIRVHVVGEPAGAADAADEHDVLARHLQLRHHLLHGGQDGEVRAPGTPAHFLIADEVLLREVELARHAISLARGASFSMALRTSATWKGFPCTLLSPIVSIPSCPRRCSRSCPRFSSGTRIFRYRAAISSRSAGRG